MYPLANKNINSRKAFLLFGVYLLHFMLFQSAVIGFSASRDFITKTFLSHNQRKNIPNSNIAIFRTLEKHQCSEQTLKINPDFADLTIDIFDFFRLPQSESKKRYILTPHLSEASYRIYLQHRIFLL